MCSKGKCLLKCCGGIKNVSSTATNIAVPIEREKPQIVVKEEASLEIPPEPPEPEEKPPSIVDEMGDSSSPSPTPDMVDAATSIDNTIIKPKRTIKRRYSTVKYDQAAKDKSVRDVTRRLTDPEGREIGAKVFSQIASTGNLIPTSRSMNDERKTWDATSDAVAEMLRAKESSRVRLESRVYAGFHEPKIVVHDGKEESRHTIKREKRGTQEIKYGFLLPPTRTPPKLLLVFPQQDPVADTQTRAAEKLGFEVNIVGNEEAALELFQQKSHELVIVDTRSPKSIDYNTLCRSIRNTRGSQHSALVAVVKKCMFEKDDVAIMGLLDSGFNRCIVENTNVVCAVNEIIQLKHSDVQPMAQHATCQSVYAALDKCKDVVIITDDSYRCQYANRACERYLGIRPDEILGKTLQEQLAYDALQITTMGSSLHRGREWNGALTLKKKSNDPILTSCRAVPISCAGRLPTHFVLVLDTSHSYDGIGQSRGSVPSVRRQSTDVRSVGSDHTRRTSLAKLPLEAPITKLICLIDQAKDSTQSNAQVVQLLEKVEEILRGPELYAPHVREDRHEEPIVSELISALLSKQSHPSLAMSSRRSSNDSSVYRPSKGGVIKVPAALKELLDEALSWEFDIFRLEELTKKRPLQYLGMTLFANFDVAAVLNCDEKILLNWLIIIEANYHADNTYHNSTHAADVMQATAGFLEREKLKSIMDSLDEATSLIAAAAHDVDHPGKSNAFLSNSDNPLAILYNDITILESHHAALMFKLTLGDERVNIFKNLEKETYKIARHNVIDMILATEMTKHFEHLAKFVNVFCTKTSNSDIECDMQDNYPLLTQPENITLIKRMVIKCSDVSNPTRPLRLCVEWARRIAEEYFQQTDEEKDRGLPVVMPMFDRNTCSIPKSQIGFVDYIINDMFEAWNAFIDMPDLITYMRQNYIRWKEFDEQGLNTVADISKLQTNVLLCPMFPVKASKSN